MGKYTALKIVVIIAFLAIVAGAFVFGFTSHVPSDTVSGTNAGQSIESMPAENENAWITSIENGADAIEGVNSPENGAEDFETVVIDESASNAASNENEPFETVIVDDEIPIYTDGDETQANDVKAR